MPEFGVCIDCGERSELRLPRRFPHICTDCLFPVTPVDPNHEQYDAVGRLVPAKRLVDQLNDRVLTIGRIGEPGERRLNG